MKRSNSDRLFEEAKGLFPGGVNSPVRAFGSVSGSPLFIRKGDGCRIWDADDNEFIDFCCSWGPLILGHNHPEVRESIITAVEKGTTFGTPTEYGLELGKLIIENNRFIDKIRFVSSGTEAVMSAIRLARGVTGRNKIIKFDGCYHGHVDHLLVKAGSGLATFGVSSSAGVPAAFAEETIVLELNDLEGLGQVFEQNPNDVAAIIIEPIPANNGLLIQNQEYLSQLRNICTEHGALLIFDEVISGFRVGFEGAAARFNIQPDIITYGKIIGGGMPVGAYAASAKIMSHVAPEGAVYQAGTLSANPVAMAAGTAQLKELLKPDFYQKLADKTDTFCNEVNKYAEEKDYPVKLVAMASIFWISFAKELEIKQASQIDGNRMSYFKLLHAALLEGGVYLGPSGYEVGFVSAAHSSDDLKTTAQAFKDSFDHIFN